MLKSTQWWAWNRKIWFLHHVFWHHQGIGKQLSTFQKVQAAYLILRLDLSQLGLRKLLDVILGSRRGHPSTLISLPDSSHAAKPALHVFLPSEVQVGYAPDSQSPHRLLYVNLLASEFWNFHRVFAFPHFYVPLGPQEKSLLMFLIAGPSSAPLAAAILNQDRVWRSRSRCFTPNFSPPTLEYH